MVQKLVQTPGVFCASAASTRKVLVAPLPVVPTKYWARRLDARTTASILSVARFALSSR